MKGIKFIISIFLLILVGAIISYADIKYNNEYNDYNKLIDTFNITESEFKFYNIKANSNINYNVSKNNMMEACIDLINNLGFEESDVKWDQKWNDNQKQIYAQIENKNKNISIVGIKKNDNEAYIIVDILENKVYKDIVDIYTIIEDTLNMYSDDTNINVCISGEYTKKLQNTKYNDIFAKILYNMNAKEIDRIEDETFISITAYSKLLDENYLEYLGNKINLNIGMRYSEDEDKTLLYIATPIIKLDY